MVELLLHQAAYYSKITILVHSFLHCSVDKIKDILSPVIVIHGTDDEVIDFSHGLEIYDKLPEALDPLWVEGAGHNDVELYGGYLDRLKKLVDEEYPQLIKKKADVNKSFSRKLKK